MDREELYTAVLLLVGPPPPFPTDASAEAHVTGQIEFSGWWGEAQRQLDTAGGRRQVHDVARFYHWCRNQERGG